MEGCGAIQKEIINIIDAGKKTHKTETKSIAHLHKWIVNPREKVIASERCWWDGGLC
jgi:hypothetical protein